MSKASETSPSPLSPYEIDSGDDYSRVSFSAMASPCELLIDVCDTVLTEKIAERVVAEVKRIEAKFSRYRQDNLCYMINNSHGESVAIDDETHNLLQFAQSCYELSDGYFDLTSGILRRAWKFDCSDRVPEQSQIDQLIPFIGWDKVSFNAETLTLPDGMELDFGGIGKEYAVSKACQLCRELAPGISVLVNLGGDIEVSETRSNKKKWTVGVERADASGQTPQGLLTIVDGALATSGDTKRYLQKGTRRYSHILNPKTGWPIEGGPSSVTVAAQLCIQAGCLATIALLHGKQAPDFLRSQQAKFWCSSV